MNDFDPRRRILYRVEGMNHTATRRNEVYLQDGQTKLLMDLQLPPNLSAGTKRPAVFFVHGGPIPEGMEPPKQWGFFQSYAALAAASGMVGVTFNHRLFGPTDYVRSLADVAAAVNHVRTHADELHVDPDRIALWYFSGGGPLLTWVLRERPEFVRCVVAFYPMLDLRHVVPAGSPPQFVEGAKQLSPAAHLSSRACAGLPMFIARAGLDSSMLNQSVDLFVREALSANAALELINHPEGHHSFDLLDDNSRTCEVIASAITFLQTHLQVPGYGA